MKEEYNSFGKCPFGTVQKIISGKWAVVTLHNLSSKTLRFGEL